MVPAVRSLADVPSWLLKTAYAWRNQVWLTSKIVARTGRNPSGTGAAFRRARRFFTELSLLAIRVVRRTIIRRGRDRVDGQALPDRWRRKQSVDHWGVALALRQAGAKLAITYLNQKAELRVRPLAESVDAPIVTPLDVTREEDERR
jgi:Enoyl-(Acyl carrier protein) reductase